MLKKFNLIFVTCFNIGKIKFASGTFASLITCVFFFFVVDLLGVIILFFITLFIFLYSLKAINSAFESFSTHDPREIVIDEIVGQMLPLLALPIYETLYPIPKVYYCLTAFLLFRLFDVWKPYPINFIDKNVKGELGIMLDDILAGVYVIIILIITFFFLGA